MSLLFDEVAGLFLQTPEEELLNALEESQRQREAQEGNFEDEDDEPSFRSENPSGWSATRDALAEVFRSDVYSLTSVGNDVERFANRYYEQNGTWPSISELFADQDLNGYMTAASSGLTAVLPLTFRQGNVLFANDPWQGIVPVFRGEDPSQIPEGTGLSRADLASLGAMNFDGQTFDVSAFAFRSNNPLRNVPEFTAEQIQARLGILRKPTGGGGGGARQAVFDLDQLEERYRSIYRSTLLEDPGEIRDLMKKYQAEYRAFSRAGGSLDFDTWAMKKIRALPKYGVLYAHKPDFMDETQFINQYTGSAFSSGLSADRAREEVVAGASAGASAGGFAERVGRAQGVDTGGAGFGRRLANLTNQMGVAGT